MWLVVASVGCEGATKLTQFEYHVVNLQTYMHYLITDLLTYDYRTVVIFVL